MADQTQASIEIEAASEVVMGVVANIEAYPGWVDSLESAEVLSSDAEGRPDRVRMSLRHPVISDTYTLAYSWAPDTVSWRLVEGRKLTAMDGSYTLRDQDGGTEVTYRLSVALTLPMVGLLRRKAEKTIIDGALTGLRRRVRQLAEES